MNPEIFIHYGNRLRTRSKKMYRKSLKAIVVSKRNFISSTNITIHYAKEIRLQAKVFRANFKQINKYDYERNKI
jgi:formate hydrogenlyase subunit 6/NADH:ubiquinone oxidoreductase subunit I